MSKTEEQSANEIIAASLEAKKQRDAATKTAASAKDKDANWPIGKIGLGVGVGSAAIAAALLYHSRKK